MKIIHQNGYSKEELIRFKPVVYRNLVDSARDLVRGMRQLGLSPEEPTNEVCYLNCVIVGYLTETQRHEKIILEYQAPTDPNHTIDLGVVNAISSLWHDPLIPHLMDRSSEFYLMDSAP